MMGQQNHLTDDTPIYGSIKSIWYNYFCCIFAFGNFTHEQVMASMRLFAQEVMPSLQ
jgi:hypothetical protein